MAICRSSSTVDALLAAWYSFRRGGVVILVWLGTRAIRLCAVTATASRDLGGGGRIFRLLVLSLFAGLVLGCSHERGAPQHVAPPPPTEIKGQCPVQSCPYSPPPDAGVVRTPKDAIELGELWRGPPGGLVRCSDRKSTGGYTGRCLRARDGSCYWERLDCPPDTEAH